MEATMTVMITAITITPIHIRLDILKSIWVSKRFKGGFLSAEDLLLCKLHGGTARLEADSLLYGDPLTSWDVSVLMFSNPGFDALLFKILDPSAAFVK